MPLSQDVEHRGVWRDLSMLGAGVDWSAGPADLLRGRGVEEYARWLAWLLRVVRDAGHVLPLLGMDSPAAVQMCGPAPAEALPVGCWVLVRFPGKAFIAVRLGGESALPSLVERAAVTGLPVWRTRFNTRDSFHALARRMKGICPFLAQHRGWEAAGVAAYFAICAGADASCMPSEADSA
jgi:hypothetical protein